MTGCHWSRAAGPVRASRTSPTPRPPSCEEWGERRPDGHFDAIGPRLVVRPIHTDNGARHRVATRRVRTTRALARSIRPKRVPLIRRCVRRTVAVPAGHFTSVPGACAADVLRPDRTPLLTGHGNTPQAEDPALRGYEGTRPRHWFMNPDRGSPAARPTGDMCGSRSDMEGCHWSRAAGPVCCHAAAHRPPASLETARRNRSLPTRRYSRASACDPSMRACIDMRTDL